MERFESIDVDHRVRHRRRRDRRTFQRSIANRNDRRAPCWRLPKEWRRVEKDGVVVLNRWGWHYTEWGCLSAIFVWQQACDTPETRAELRAILRTAGNIDPSIVDKRWERRPSLPMEPEIEACSFAPGWGRVPGDVQVLLWPGIERQLRAAGYQPSKRADFQWPWVMLSTGEYAAVWDAFTPAERKTVIDWSHSVPRFPGQAYREWDRQLRVVRRELLGFACHWTCYIAFQHWLHGTTSDGEQLARALMAVTSPAESRRRRRIAERES